MAKRLPPDLQRVGDELVAGVERSLAARRRRRRLFAHSALTGVAALAAAAAFVPSTTGPGAGRSSATPTAGALFAAHIPAVPAACDLPLGGRLSAPACRASASASGGTSATTTSDPVPLGRPGRW
jgi:peptidoglycan/LPS O-acetylase OafA/YrhL